MDTMIDRVWGDAPPDHARNAVYVYVARLRRILGEAAENGSSAELLRRSRGYVLEVPPEHVDLHRYRMLVGQARDRGDDEGRRAMLLRQALGLWRDEALADLPGEWAARVREGWRQSRIDATVHWADAELRLQNSTAVIGRLSDIVDQHPLNEPLVAALMRALHTVGRRAQALDCFATVRARLVDHLGVEPGAELRELHQEILRDDPDRDSPPSAITMSTTERPVLLPLDVRGFVCRDRELAHLDALLASTAAQPGSVTVAAVSGTAGVGKSALAVHWAHRVAARFPDGQLYVNLRGYDATRSVLSPGDVICGLLRALRVPARSIPPDVEGQVALYRSVLAGKRMLVLLDNARDTEQVRPLLPAASGCFVLVTSRDELTGLVAVEGAYPLFLDLPSMDDARALLSCRLGRAATMADPAAVDEIITSCARLPLAMVIVAARVAARPQITLAAFVEELREAGGGLDACDGGDPATNIRAVFSWSYRTLNAEAARMFRLLGRYCGADIAPSAAASLAGIRLGQARKQLARLARVHLVAQRTSGRYTFHDLLRAYAAELCDTVDTVPERRAAAHRLLDHYVHTAHEAARRLEPHREFVGLAPAQPGTVSITLETPAQASAWLTRERATLVHMVSRAAEEGFGAHASSLAWALTTFLQRGGHWRDLATVHRIALAAARSHGDVASEVQAHLGLARAHLRLARSSHNARHHLCQALDLFVEQADEIGQARAQCGPGIALNDLGWSLAQIGDYTSALVYCWEALSVFERIGDFPGQASVLDTLGYIYQHLGDHQQAFTCFHQALDLFHQVGERYLTADTLTHLGDNCRATGDLGAARQVWRDALDVLEELDHPDADGVRVRLAELAGSGP